VPNSLARFILPLTLVLHAPRLAAQSVDPRLLDVTLSPGALVGLETAWIPGHLHGYGGLGLSYANDEVVARNDEGARTETPLHTRWVTTLGFGLGLFDRMELQLALPLHAYGAAAFGPGSDARSLGLGDVRTALRFALLRPEASGLRQDGEAWTEGLGLVLQVAAYLPTGGTTRFSGDDALVVEPRMVVDWHGDTGLTLALHGGYRLRPERELAGVTFGDELRYGAGLELPFTALGAPVPLALLTELEGALRFGVTADAANANRSEAEHSLEARFGLRLYGERWAMTVATGAGLFAGYGAPDIRFFLGFTFSPGSAQGPRPLAVRADSERLASPDSGPAHAPTPTPSFTPVAGFTDPGVLTQALRDDPDADADGVPLPADQCPLAAEDPDGHDDSDGCPDPDDDGDGVPDLTDKCPDGKETPNGIADDDGCPDEGQVTVLARDGVIELDQAIEFRSGSDVLATSAAPLIAQVAAMLKANPQIKRIRIEGHTDNEGDEEMNVDLSERRAARARQKLIELGIEPGRLLARGFGATRGLGSNDTAAGRKQNRRVEFHIIDPPPPGAPRIETLPEVTP